MIGLRAAMIHRALASPSRCDIVATRGRAPAMLREGEARRKPE
jgi:hypothetical protein